MQHEVFASGHTLVHCAGSHDNGAGAVIVTTATAGDGATGEAATAGDTSPTGAAATTGEVATAGAEAAADGATTAGAAATTGEAALVGGVSAGARSSDERYQYTTKRPTTKKLRLGVSMAKTTPNSRV